MSLTYSAAVEQTITAGEQIHQIVNGTATTEVTVEDGSKVPSIRKALLDNFYFKDPIVWQVGQTENVFNQLRLFTDGSWWYAPSATESNPISMGSTPVGDSLWKIYDFDAIGKLEPRIDESLRRSYAEAGYNLVDGSFEAGGTLVNANDVLLQEASGRAYSWSGSYPTGVYVVPPNSAPIETAWVDRSTLAYGAGIVRNGRFALRDYVSVMDFDAVGDGVADDSVAFQKAANYLNAQGIVGTLYIPNRQFAIGQEVILGKVNLLGGSMTRAGAGCIVPVAGYTGKLFNWNGARISNLTMRGTGKKATAIWMDDGYNRTIENCEIGNFEHGIYIQGITVNFTVNDCTYHGNKYAFFIEDKDGEQSTTTYFNNVMFQWCDYGIWCEKDVYGFSFNNIIMEHIKVSAFRAKWWGGCKWDTIWWEGRQTPENTGYCIDVGIVSGYEGCTAVNLNPRAPWINNISSSTVDDKNALTGFGGMAIDKGSFRVRNSYGSSLNLHAQGLHFDVDTWLQGANNRTMKLSTRDSAPDSGYITDIAISPGIAGRIFIENGNVDSTASPLVRWQQTGNDINGARRYYLINAISKRFSIRTTGKLHAEAVNSTRVLDLLTHYVYDSTQQTTLLAGAMFSATGPGVIRLEIPVGTDDRLTSDEFNSPAVLVSGIESGEFLVHRMVAIPSYSGSWSSYRACKGFVFYFVNLQGVPTSPKRFTVSITST